MCVRVMLVLAFVVLGLGLPSSAVGAATAGAGVGHARVATTRVVLRVEGCRGCRVMPISAPVLDLSDPVEAWMGRQKRVRNGRVAFDVPTGRTRGLYFDVDDPGSVSTGARTIAVVRYRGHAAGDRVTSRQAARTRRAHHCWAGTGRARVRMRLVVDRFPSEDVYTEEKGYAIRPYFNPTRASFGPANPTWKGTLGAQDWFYCKVVS